MSRRHFMKQSTALAGGLLLHQSMMRAFAAGAPAHQISVGIIGCGDRGGGLLEMMNSMPENFSVKALCDVLPFRLKAASAKAPAAKTYTDYRRLLDDKAVEAVVIATPLYLHFEHAKAALESGRQVYLEKTMAFTIPEVLKLVRLAEQHHNQVLQIGHQYRYTPLYFKVKEYIERGWLGDVTGIDCRWDRNWNWRRPVPEPSLERAINWRMYREYSGGLAAELLSHQMDFINWAFNTSPDVVMATGGIDHYKDGRETFDNLQVTLRYNRSGMIGNFGATCANARDGYLFKIKGSKGTISLLMNEGKFYPEPETRKELQTVDGVTGATKIEWTKDGGIPILDAPAKDGTYYALQDFYKAVTQKAVPASNKYTGATAAICVHLANEAAYNGTIQHWKPEFNFKNNES